MAKSPAEQTEAEDTAAAPTTGTPEAEQTSSPDGTESASSSDAAVKTEEKELSPAEHIREEFLKKWGDEDDQDAPASEETTARAAPDAEKPDGQKAADDGPQDTLPKLEGEEKDFRLSDEQFKALAEPVRQRIGYLNARAHKAEKAQADAQAQYESVKDQAENFVTMQTFAADNQFEAGDIALAFGVIADLRAGNHAGFLEKMRPIYEGVMQMQGEMLTPDLQKRVEDGLLSEEDARELQKAQLLSQDAQERADKAAKRVAQRDEADNQVQLGQQILQATVDREAQLQASDPDFAKHQPAIGEIMKGWLALRLPNTAEEAVQWIDRAYAQAKALAPTPPQPRPTPPSPSAASTKRGTPPQSATDEIDDPRQAMMAAVIELSGTPA